jgi:YD repeat-containing protein
MIRSKRVSLFLLFTANLFLALAQAVDPLSGRLQLSIPLGQLQVLDVIVPIGLYHHGGPLRVADGNGSCGLGWNLSAGGAVTRFVRGIPDDYNVTNDQRKGWLFDSNSGSVNSFSPSGDDNLSTCADEQNDWNYLEGRGYTKDTEPDVYYISAPGLNAQFVFGTDGNPKLLTYQDIQITVNKNASQVITGFVVKNNTGMTYTFTFREDISRRAEKWRNRTPIYFQTEFNQYSTELTFTSAWLLSSIQSQATGTTASFTYENGEESYSSRYHTRIKQTATNSADTMYYTRDRVTPKYLKQITIRDHKVTIDWSNGLVTRVSFGQLVPGNEKQYDFIYAAMHSASDVTEPKQRKSFLKEIKQVRNCNSYPSYKFTYGYVDLGAQTVQVPWENNHGQDWFGYYNAASGNKNIPTVYYYSSQSDAKRLRTTLNGTPTTTLTGSNRAPSLLPGQFGAIVRIDWPTGGYTAMDYELNTYKETGITGDLTGSGIRVIKISSSGGENPMGKGGHVHHAYRLLTKEYEYKLADGTSSGKLLYPAALAFATGDSIIRTVNSLGEPSEVLYSRVKEKITGQGSRIFEFEIPGTFPSTVDGLWKATKSRVARDPSQGCPPAGNLKNGFYTFPYPPSSNYNFARGLLKKVTEYSETGTPVRERTITSYTDLTVNATVVKGLAFEKIGSTYHFGQYEVLTGRAKVPSQEIIVEMSEETPSVNIQTTITYTYNANNMLETVTTTNTDGSVMKVKTKYAKGYVLNTPTDTASVALKALNDGFRHGELVERISRFTPPGGTEKVVGAELVTYRDFGGGRILPYYIRTLPQGADLTESSVSGQALVFDSDYQLVKTLKEYDANGYLINESDYKRNRVGYHYAVNFGLPVATFANARAQQAVYEGFEMMTGRGLTSTPFSNGISGGRTGEKAFLLTTAYTLSSSSVDLIQKGENKYRVSCWVNAAQATNITFRAKNGSTTQASLVLSNPVNNQWVYLEGEMNTSSVSTNFRLEVVSNNTVTIDDIVFMPKSARISFNTVSPVNGITSVTDDRGNSVKYTHDEYGRLQNTFDRQRNLTARTEYVYQEEELPTLSPHFTSNRITYETGQQATFTAAANCLNVTYSWQLFKTGETPLATGTNSTFQYTFNAPGQYNLKLTVVSDFDQASYTQTICVNFPSTSPQLSVTHNAQTDPYKEYSCNGDDNVKTFTITNLPSGEGVSFTFIWMLLHPGGWYEIPNTANLSSIEYVVGGSDHTFRCIIGVQYTGGLCNGSPHPIVNTDFEWTITHHNNEPCP